MLALILLGTNKEVLHSVILRIVLENIAGGHFKCRTVTDIVKIQVDKSMPWNTGRVQSFVPVLHFQTHTHRDSALHGEHSVVRENCPSSTVLLSTGRCIPVVVHKCCSYKVLWKRDYHDVPMLIHAEDREIISSI